MPGYVSHTVMANDIYNRIDIGNINLDYMLTYSLGGDLCKYAKCRYDSHHVKLDEFLYNMADYMIDNNLIDDQECLGVLYGHISHYIMDDTVHPLVRKVSSICVKNKKNHGYVEMYYNMYLTNKIFNMDIKKYVRGKILSGKVNKKIAKMIDYVYMKTYNCSNVSRYYKFNIFLYRLERILMIISTNLLYRMYGLNKFIMINSDIDLVNSKGTIKYKDYNLSECNDDLIKLYNDSIDRTIKYINKMNNYLNDRK